MEKDYILSQLCFYDNRNPEYVEDGIKKDDCYCDNCFYGRTVLAEEILRLKEAIEKAIQSLTHFHHLPENYLNEGVVKTVKKLKAI